MAVLAEILTSEKVKVDKARQVRLWSGMLKDDKDFEASIVELLPFYAPPENPSRSDHEEKESTEFKGSIKFHSATQNYAFGVNMPRFDVSSHLKDIKVSDQPAHTSKNDSNLNKVPTIVLVGRHDYVTPVVYSSEIANSIPHARLEIFEWSGHSPASDEPEKFERALSDWLKSENLHKF